MSCTSQTRAIAIAIALDTIPASRCRLLHLSIVLCPSVLSNIMAMSFVSEDNEDGPSNGLETSTRVQPKITRTATAYLGPSSWGLGALLLPHWPASRTRLRGSLPIRSRVPDAGDGAMPVELWGSSWQCASTTIITCEI